MVIGYRYDNDAVAAEWEMGATTMCERECVGQKAEGPNRMEQCAGFLRVVLVPPLQYIPG